MPNHNRMFDLVRHTIAQHGVYLTWIGDGDPAFAYSVGLARHDHPELIVFSLDMHTSEWLLNNLAFRVRDGVQTFEAGQLVDGIVDKYPLLLLEVADSSEHLTVANRMYRRPGGPPLPALQVILPDKDNRWPWDPNSRLHQPLLGTPPPDVEALRRVHAVEHDPTTWRPDA